MKSLKIILALLLVALLISEMSYGQHNISTTKTNFIV